MSKEGLRKELEEMVDEAMDASDEEVLADWRLAGERLLAETPEEFRERYRYMLSAFADKPRLEPTLENWVRLGAKLLADPRIRRVMLKISLATNMMFEQQETQRNLS